MKKHFTNELINNIKLQSGNIEQALIDTYLKIDQKLFEKEVKDELLNEARRLRSEEESKINDRNKRMDMFKSLFDPIYMENCNVAMFTGSTACVCVIDNDTIYFANAGDSGAIVITIDECVKHMTREHKPDNEEEKSRIIKAGGVLEDRRVGNLNLSRTIGDLEYKQNKMLKPEQQIITAHPEIKKINRSDVQYIIIACDGVWDCKHHNISEFIVNKIKKENKLSNIIEEFFEKIVSKESRDDGVGCDNMTCIMIQFK